MRIKGILKALFILIMLTVPNLALAEIMGVASVVDGDTIEIRGTRIRFYGIDAPETGQTCSIDGDVYSISSDTYRCGQQAALALADRIGSDPIYCDERDTDRYGRVAAVCWLNDEDLSAWMVQEGWARAYHQYSHDYVSQEEISEREHRGIWRGDFINPWDWRKGQRLGTGQADDDLASSGQTLAVKVNAANVRATPSRNSRLVTTIRRGETVEEIGDAGDWYQVRLKSWLSVWIFADLLGPPDAPKEVEQPIRSRPRPARTAPMTDLLPEAAPSQSQPRTCCKRCSKGQPCGNSCISWRYTCRKPPGCAC